MSRLRIGNLLVSSGRITKEQLATALEVQKKTRKRVGRILTELGYLSEYELVTFLAQHLGIPYVDLSRMEVSRETLQLLPETHARRLRAIPLEVSAHEVQVAMADPTDLVACDELKRILRRPIRQAIVREADLLATIDRLYRRTEEIRKLAGELHQELSESDFELEGIDIGGEAAEAPVAKLLQSIFADAVQVGASDIHIEPDENALRIRQRVDGILYENVMSEGRIASALVLRLKLMTGLDISEKRMPQDGRFHLKVKGRGVDVRLSTMPTQYGESVVMRLLMQDTELQRLAGLGMPSSMRQKLERLIRQPYGLILVTGPTGSGKTTTLYAALTELNEAGVKIITVEDPVEYRIPRLSQIQVNPKIGLGFAQVLRSALRQDPDILMVGEMRDQETAEIAMRAALTGHLVLSTLHTNDAISSGLRLIDMGVQGYVAASALRAVLAQRLVRRICARCSAEHTPDAQEGAWLEGRLGPGARKLSFSRGVGCAHCHGTGYRGRIGIFELLEIDAEMAEALRGNDHAGYVSAARRRIDRASLAHWALQYASRGATTLQEVLRVVEYVDSAAVTAPAEGRTPGVREP